MTTTDVLNPHSEAELDKAIRLELGWFASYVGETATLRTIRNHQHTLKGLYNDLAVEQMVNRSLRKNDKGVEITNPQARSWHK